MIDKIYQQLKTTIQQFYDNNPNWVVVLRWTTATGKTETSIRLAKDFPFEIISSDSRQIFKYMDIWTDKIPYWADYYEKDLAGIISNNIMNKSIYDLWNLRTFNLKYWKNSNSECFDYTKLVPVDWRGSYLKNAWAWQKECYNDDPVRSNLRWTSKVNPLVIEYNSNITKISPYIINNN